MKTHLFPRALMLDMRGDAKALREGSRHKAGYSERQNGRWDRFLCEAHEKAFGAADDYAVSLCRQVASLAVSTSETVLRVANPQPDLFTKFALATVWRHVKAPCNAYLKLDLGRYEPLLRAAVFDDAPHDIEVLAGVTNLTLGDGEAIEFGMEPYRTKLRGLWVWHFVVGRMAVYVKTDRRGFPQEWRPYLANGNDTLTLTLHEPLDFARVPMLRPITDRIRESARHRSSS